MADTTPKMSAESFAYWMNGFFENIKDGQSLSSAQTQAIKSHLGLVFDKVADSVEVKPNESLQESYKKFYHDHRNNKIPPMFPVPNDFPAPVLMCCHSDPETTQLTC